MKKAKLYLCHWDLLKNVECSLRLHVLDPFLKQQAVVLLFLFVLVTHSYIL